MVFIIALKEKFETIHDIPSHFDDMIFYGFR